MLPYPEIDPVAFSIGPLSVHWYGIAYLLSFLGVWRIAVWQTQRPWCPIKKGQVEDLIFYGAMGVVLGGRFGYVFFYQFSRFLDEPLWLFKVWEGGMSFHGGLLGVIIALALYARRLEIHFLDLGDFIAPLAPIGLFLGRIANFIGGELWGRPTTGWWGMIFPTDPLAIPRHPSQLYEAFLEGLVLFVVLMLLARKQKTRGLLSGLFLLLYGSFRFLVEFAREPDAHLQDLLFGWMSRGQTLCLPMIIIGITLIVIATKKSSGGKIS
ncbi:MAG: prolipoprotein diacylglyceryl transferase [Porticoccaceae bacterium]|jgi:phosphatidylglycerol---prolipoprotein diacylglyceryl transferase|nr:prolipoprotein diacylglyceryl transferase [Porticoccaceae bacterium]